MGNNTPESRASEQASEQQSGYDVGKLLSQGGFQVSTEELGNIEREMRKNPKLLQDMQRDFPATVGNSVEKSRFETVYLKGY